MRKEGDRLIIEPVPPKCSRPWSRSMKISRRSPILRRSGNDLLIAAQALTLGHTIVTDNESEFARIRELPRENWLRAP